MNHQAQIAIRTRKLGVLIRDARSATRKTLTECATAIGITPATLRAYEDGKKSPSLPELEVLAYYLELPIQHFWQNTALSNEKSRTEPLNLKMLASIRHRIIGVLLTQKRQQMSISQKALATEIGIPASRLKAYETGEKPIPLPELEVILAILGTRIEIFFDQNSPVGQWMSDQQSIQEFLKLPPELRNFVCMPVNRPYLELALKLSSLPTNKLRSVAEGLLDITL